MEIRVWFIGIHIQEVELARLANRLSRPAEMFEAGLKAYLLTSSGWEGFVLGGSLHTVEDDEPVRNFVCEAYLTRRSAYAEQDQDVSRPAGGPAHCSERAG
jgi:hypothetical protein